MKNVIFYLACTIFSVNSLLLLEPSNYSEAEICVSRFIRQLFNESYAIYYVSDGHDPIIPVDKYNENQYVIVNINKPILGLPNYPRYYIVHVNSAATLSKVKASYKILWELGITNVAIFSYVYKYIYQDDPFHSNNYCGKRSAMLHFFSCKTLKMLNQNRERKYNNCSIDFKTPYKPEDVHSQNVITRFIMNELQNHLKLYVKFINPNSKKHFVGNISFSIENSKCSIYHSNSIYTDHFGWVIFVNKVPSLIILQYAFQKIVWFMIGVTFVLTSFVWLVINKVTTRRFNATKVFTDVWSLTLLGCIRKISDLPSLKTLILLYLWFVIVIHTAFKTNLAKILTVDQYEDSIDNIVDLVNSRRPLCVHQSLIKMHFLKDKPTDPVYTKIKAKITPIDTWEKIWENRTCVYLMYMQDIQILKNRNYQFNYFEDNTLIPYKYSFRISKGYYFKYILDNFIRALVENGISEHVILTNTKKNTYRNKHEMEKEAPKVLTLDNVYGVFVCWAVGIAVSITAFVFEIVSSKCRLP
ncbi:hypothetical protein FQA39_LY16105 [Lamprigera yunnana]|nr:hypothetical protein FQA39_LY16105 [Lamprigera yunnana]